MTPELMDFFRGEGCFEIPEYKEHEAIFVMRQLAICAKCQGLSSCRVRGMPQTFIINDDKSQAFLVVGPCKNRKTADNQRAIQQLFVDATIPPDLQNCGIDNYNTQGLGGSIIRAKQEAEKAIESGGSIVFAGSAGLGKTHLSVAIARAALNRGNSVLFISAIGYLQSLRTTFEKKEGDRYARMLDKIKTVDCLVIDDFGAEKPSSWTIERLYDAINTRTEQQAQTVITTNYVRAMDLLERLKEDPIGAERIASRLISWGWIIMEGKDYRTLKHKK